MKVCEMIINSEEKLSWLIQNIERFWEEAQDEGKELEITIKVISAS